MHILRISATKVVQMPVAVNESKNRITVTVSSAKCFSGYSNSFVVTEAPMKIKD